MKKSVKSNISSIVVNDIKYKVSGNNRNLSKALSEEQKNFCAYTEKQFSSTDQAEIDHFDPTLKGTAGDNYKNWYLIMAKWNRKKSKKWADYQPLIHPTNTDFFQRIWYEDGIYNYKKGDTEAKNLLNLLDINNKELTKERENYIERMKDLEQYLGKEDLRSHLLKFPDQIHFISAFETEFGYGFIMKVE